MEFRRRALTKRDAPDDLRAPLRLTPARSWIVLALLAAVVAGGTAWGFLGEVPSSTQARGVLSYVRGSFGVNAPATGQVSRVSVLSGNEVQAGAAVAQLEVDGRPVTVRTATAGRVATVLAAEGQFVRAGEVLAVVERTGGPDDRVVAVLYLPAASGAFAPVGARVDLAVDSAPPAQFGLMRGTVTSVGAAPEGRRQIADFLGDEETAAELTASGPARRIVVDLLREAGSPDRYVWTHRDGPPFAVTTRTGVRGLVHQPPIRPVDWVLP
jgi:pyruvate/2-oxoglutarate dehydrogenase complex dihydrolipoamide acyltransferase (E2) component